MTREQLIRDLRKFARRTGREFEVDKRRGKGSHYSVRLGQRRTTIPSHLYPVLIDAILRQLDVDPADL